MKCVSISTLAQTASGAVLLASLAAAQGYNIDISTGVQVAPSPYYHYPEVPAVTFAGAANQPGVWNTVNTPTNYPAPTLNPIVTFGLRDSSGAFTTVTCTATYPGVNPAAEDWGVKDINGQIYIQAPPAGGDPSWGALQLDFQLLPQVPQPGQPNDPVTYTFTNLPEGYYDVYTYVPWLPGTPGTTIIDVNGTGPQALSNPNGLYNGAALPAYVLGQTHSIHRVYIAAATATAPGTPLVVSAVTANNAQLVHPCADFPAPWPNCGGPVYASQCGGGVSGIQIVPVTQLFASSCAGDNITDPCPCHNDSGYGSQAGCMNSFGFGGLIVPAGVPSLAASTFVLNGTNLGNPNPAVSNTVRLLASFSSSPTAASIMEDGILCLTGTIIRLGTYPSVGGSVQIPVPVQMPNGAGQIIPIQPGQVVSYQVHYRDLGQTFCTAGLGNTSNMVSAYWVP